MKIIVKEKLQVDEFGQRTYSYDKSLTNSFHKKDKGYYVQLMTKQQIAKKVAKMNHMSAKDILKSYKDMIDNKHSELIDKYIVAFIAKKTYKHLHQEFNGYPNYWRLHNKYIVNTHEVSDGKCIMLNGDTMIMFKNLKDTILDIKNKIRWENKKDSYFGKPSKNERELIQNKEMLNLQRIVEKRMFQIGTFDIEFHNYKGEVSTTKLYVRPYQRKDKVNNSIFVINKEDFSIESSHHKYHNELRGYVEGLIEEMESEWRMDGMSDLFSKHLDKMAGQPYTGHSLLR